MFRDRQAKARPFGVACLVRLVEALEQPLLFRRGDADPGIGSPRSWFPAPPAIPDVNPASRRGELDGVVDQVDQHLLHAFRDPAGPGWSALRLDLHGQPGPLDLGPQPAGTAPREVDRIDSLVVRAWYAPLPGARGQAGLPPGRSGDRPQSRSGQGNRPRYRGPPPPRTPGFRPSPGSM